MERKVKERSGKEEKSCRKEGKKTRPKVITVEGGKEGLREIGRNGRHIGINGGQVEGKKEEQNNKN